MSKKRKNNSSRPQQGNMKGKLLPAHPDMTPEELEELQRKAGMEQLQVETDADGVDIIPISKGKTDAGSYRFRIDGSNKLYRLPNLQYIDMDIAMQLTAGADDEHIMRLMFQRYVPELLAQTDAEQLTAIANRWRQHSKIEAGQDVSLGE